MKPSLSLAGSLKWVGAMQAGRVVGLLTLENVSEMMMINTALEQNSRTLGQRHPA